MSAHRSRSIHNCVFKLFKCIQTYSFFFFLSVYLTEGDKRVSLAKKLLVGCSMDGREDVTHDTLFLIYLLIFLQTAQQDRKQLPGSEPCSRRVTLQLMKRFVPVKSPSFFTSAISLVLKAYLLNSWRKKNLLRFTYYLRLEKLNLETECRAFSSIAVKAFLDCR